jgi:hypothetical protein
MTFTTLAWWHWASDVFVDFFGGKLKTVNQKTNMASKQDCCFCLSSLKNSNGPQLCSSRLNNRLFCHPKWRVNFDDTSYRKTSE